MNGMQEYRMSDAQCRELAEAFVASRNELARQTEIAIAEDGYSGPEASPEEQAAAIARDVINCLRSGGHYLVGGNGIAETTITLYWGPGFPGKDYVPA